MGGRGSLFVLGLVGAACGRTPVWIGPADDVGDDADGSEVSDGPGHTSTTDPDTTGVVVECDPATGTCPIELKLRRAVDILFVVDNSGSMGGEQGTLAQSFRSFVEVLEAQQVGANYRIGITTTDGFGSLRATSCLSRLYEFEFEWEFGTIDEKYRGCQEHCAYDSVAIAEPWVEKSEGATNLPAGLDMAEVLQCIGPQGINGPGFEQPLEAMRAVIQDPTSGFLRQDALFAVIFLTDEADCSAPLENQSWLSTEGVVFWTDPDRSTSGACWSAGVQCTGGPGIYDDCVPQDFNFQGHPTSDPDDAVLYSIERYIDEINALAQKKQAEGGQGQVLLALIAGVPLDYPETGVIVYQDSEYPDFNREYGIGPACDRGTETINDPPGIPDVRLRKVVESFASDEPNVFSICSDDYGIALESIAAAIGDITERACVGGCVVDVDAQTSGLQPSCTLVERFPPDADMPDRPVEPCIVGDVGWEFPTVDAPACYRALVDTEDATETPWDDMTAQCVTRGFNLELVVERRVGVPIPSGTAVEVDCELVAPPGVRCEDV